MIYLLWFSCCINAIYEVKTALIWNFTLIKYNVVSLFVYVAYRDVVLFFNTMRHNKL